VSVAQPEALVFANDGLDDVVDGLRVLHRGSPRVAVIEGPWAKIHALAARPGVQVVEDDPPSELLARLDASEAIFARAWRQRRKPKNRAGDGLSWDAPEYQPPDRPTSLGR
jgi:hypothetical protein